jgi:hypothetical protein
VSDETSSRLLALHAFELQRASGMQPAAYLAALREEADETLFMFQFRNGQLAIRKLSSDDEELAPQYEQVEAEFGDYVGNVVSGSEPEADPAAKGVFLARTLVPIHVADKPPVVVNQLDVRSLDNSRLVYTEGTEDVWSRQGLKPTNSVAAVRERMDSDATKGIGEIVTRLETNKAGGSSKGNAKK